MSHEADLHRKGSGRFRPAKSSSPGPILHARGLPDDVPGASMRQFAGFGNRRHEQAVRTLQKGQTGSRLRLPHPPGLRLDSPRSKGGRPSGVATIRGRHGKPLQGDPQPGLDLHDDQRPGLDHASFYIAVGGENKVSPPSARHDQHLLKEFPRRTPDLSAGAVPGSSRPSSSTARHVPSGTSRPLPHPGGGPPPPGAGLHAADGLEYVRWGSSGAWTRCLRAAAFLLLRRAHRLLRGDCQVPRGPPDLGP